MLTYEDKLEIINNKINIMEMIIKSYIDGAERNKDKYVLEEVLEVCNAKKTVLLEELEKLIAAGN